MRATDPGLICRCGRVVLFLIVVAGLVLDQPGFSFAAGMNAPPNRPARKPAAVDDPATARPFLDAIHFFQQNISPVDGGRCQFAPTCSAFGSQAIHRHGPWLGLLMTTDRLMRCNYWTDALMYPRLPNGKLADPVSANLSDR